MLAEGARLRHEADLIDTDAQKEGAEFDERVFRQDAATIVIVLAPAVRPHEKGFVFGGVSAPDRATETRGYYRFPGDGTWHG
jgi:hypothetical protein